MAPTEMGLGRDQPEAYYASLARRNWNMGGFHRTVQGNYEAIFTRIKENISQNVNPGQLII